MILWLIGGQDVLGTVMGQKLFEFRASFENGLVFQLTFSTSLKNRTNLDTRANRIKLRIRTNISILIILLVLEGLSLVLYCKSWNCKTQILLQTVCLFTYLLKVVMVINIILFTSFQQYKFVWLQTNIILMHNQSVRLQLFTASTVCSLLPQTAVCIQWEKQL